MYFWHVNKLVSDLKNNHLSFTDTVIYTILLSISFIFSINVVQLLPTLYQIIFEHIKIYLEQQAAHAQLFIKIYHYMDEWFLLINLIVVLVGTIFCFIVHKGTPQRFFQRFIALSWPICFRIMILTSLLFLLSITLIGIYFGYKLNTLSQSQTPDAPPIIVKSFKFLFKAAGLLPGAKAIWTQAQMLPKVQAIFDQLNNVSFAVYWIAHIGSLLSTLWWMLTAQEKIRMLKK
jgi:hypothetical protein